MAGTSESTELISLLNLFKIRPVGVISKKVVVGARKMLCNKWLCKYLAAPRAPRNNENVDMNTAMAKKFLELQ